MKTIHLAFLKQLVSSEQETRDQGLSACLDWLVDEQNFGSNEQDLLKIWKALYLSLWVQDKPILQQAFSDQLVASLLSCPKAEFAFANLRAFWITIIREWPLIDKHRLDKYYYLLKAVLLASFNLLDNNGWKTDYCQSFSSILFDLIFDVPMERSSDGLKYFVCEYFVEMLLQVIGNELQLEADLAISLFDSFFRYFCVGKKQVVQKRIQSQVFGALLSHKPDAIDEMQVNISQESKQLFANHIVEHYVKLCKNKERKMLLLKMAEEYGFEGNVDIEHPKNSIAKQNGHAQNGSKQECKCTHDGSSSWTIVKKTASLPVPSSNSESCDSLAFEPPTAKILLELRRKCIVPWFVKAKDRPASIGSPSKSCLSIQKTSPNRDSPRIKWGRLITKEFYSSSPVCQISEEEIVETQIN